MVRKQVIETVKEYNLIQENQHIVLGLSGGPDSVCLFDVLCDLAKQMNLSIYPVHVNHMFRPGDAERDQAFVVKICKERGFPCIVFKEDCTAIANERGISSEEAGRLVRYQSFSKVCDKIEEKGVKKKDIRTAVAQNADDRAETVLFRLIRGTGPDGLSGISHMRMDEKGRAVIRPLLDVYREDIERYCEERNLSPRIDKTNLEPLYTRNKIRLDLIPYIEKEFNPELKKALNRLACISEDDREFFENMAKRELDAMTLEETVGTILVDGNRLREKDKPLTTRIMTEALHRIGLDDGLTQAHYEMFCDVLIGDNPSAEVHLPKGYYIRRQYQNMAFGIKTKKKGNTEDIHSKLKVEVMDIDDYRRHEYDKENHGAFDLDLLEKRYQDCSKLIQLRTREPGDFIFLKSGGRKKIKKLLIDMKIPKAQREEVLLVAIGCEILMVRADGIKSRYSGMYRINKGTKKVICVEIINSTW